MNGCSELRRLPTDQRRELLMKQSPTYRKMVEAPNFSVFKQEFLSQFDKLGFRPLPGSLLGKEIADERGKREAWRACKHQCLLSAEPIDSSEDSLGRAREAHIHALGVSLDMSPGRLWASIKTLHSDYLSLQTPRNGKTSREPGCDEALMRVSSLIALKMAHTKGPDSKGVQKYAQLLFRSFYEGEHLPPDKTVGWCIQELEDKCIGLLKQLKHQFSSEDMELCRLLGIRICLVASDMSEKTPSWDTSLVQMAGRRLTAALYRHEKETDSKVLSRLYDEFMSSENFESALTMADWLVDGKGKKAAAQKYYHQLRFNGGFLKAFEVAKKYGLGREKAKDALCACADVLTYVDHLADIDPHLTIGTEMLRQIVEKSGRSLQELVPIEGFEGRSSEVGLPAGVPPDGIYMNTFGKPQKISTCDGENKRISEALQLFTLVEWGNQMGINKADVLCPNAYRIYYFCLLLTPQHADKIGKFYEKAEMLTPEDRAELEQIAREARAAEPSLRKRHP